MLGHVAVGEQARTMPELEKKEKKRLLEDGWDGGHMAEGAWKGLACVMKGMTNGLTGKGVICVPYTRSGEAVGLIKEIVSLSWPVLVPHQREGW